MMSLQATTIARRQMLSVKTESDGKTSAGLTRSARLPILNMPVFIEWNLMILGRFLFEYKSI